jgi:DNA-binding transcriptional regulator YhcF (GntR family)
MFRKFEHENSHALKTTHKFPVLPPLGQDLGVTRQTAAKRLNQLVAARFLQKHQQGRNNYFINAPLIELFMRVSEPNEDVGELARTVEVR